MELKYCIWNSWFRRKIILAAFEISSDSFWIREWLRDGKCHYSEFWSVEICHLLAKLPLFLAIFREISGFWSEIRYAKQEVLLFYLVILTFQYCTWRNVDICNRTLLVDLAWTHFNELNWLFLQIIQLSVKCSFLAFHQKPTDFLFHNP